MKAKTPKERALRLLTVSDRSCYQLKQRLVREGFEEKQVEEAIAYCIDVGYLNDQRFAENFVAHCNRFRPMGNLRLEAELLAKGISPEIAASLLNDEDTQLNLAGRIAKQRYLQTSTISREKQIQKLANHLGRRGFTWEVIRRVIMDVAPDSLDTDL